MWLGALAASSALVACSGGGTSKAKPGPFATRADQVVADLSSGNYQAVAASFDPTMRAQLPVAVLQNDWVSYEQLLGALQSHGEPSSIMKGQLDVERVPVTMANAKGEVRITFHPDGSIAGLFFLKAGAPAP